MNFKPDFGKKFFEKHQQKLVAFANSRLGRWFFGMKGLGIGKGWKAMEVRPNSISGDWKVVGGRIQKTTVFFTSNLFQRKFERVYGAAAQLIPQAAAWKMLQPHALLGFLPLIALTVSTFNPNAHPETVSVDGEVSSGNGTVWATQRGLADGAAADDAGTTGAQIAAQFFTPNYSIARGFFLFDTSALGDTDTIDSAVLSLKGAFSTSNANTTSNHIVATTPASNTALTTADYDQVGSTSFGSHALSAWSTAAYNDITLNASGLAAITATGVSKFGARNSRDLDDSAPTGGNDSYFLTAGSASPPKLAVTHTAPTTDPVVSDDVTVSEAVTMMADENPNVFDAVTVADDVNMNMSDEPNVFDSVTVSESITLDIFGGPEVFDTVTITEAVTVHVLELVPDVFEAVTITEAITMESDMSINVSEAVAVTESISAEFPVDLPGVSEDVAVTESVSVMIDLNPSIFDAITVTESGAGAPTLNVAAARDGLVRMRSTEQSYPIMLDGDEAA